MPAPSAIRSRNLHGVERDKQCQDDILFDHFNNAAAVEQFHMPCGIAEDELANATPA